MEALLRGTTGRKSEPAAKNSKDTIFQKILLTLFLLIIFLIVILPSVSEGRLIKRLQMWGRGAVAGVLAAEMRLQGPAVQAALSRRDSLAPRLLMTSTPSAFVSRRGRMS